MAGIIHKIEEKLGMGGKKEGEKHEVEKKAGHGYSGDHNKQADHGYGSGDHQKKPTEHKEGMMEKIKDKISGGEKSHGDGEGKKKKKDKKDKKKEHGHDHDSSSSDSD